MADEDGFLDRLKREAFGKLADNAKVENVGSGISQTTKITVGLAKYVDGGDLKQPAWSENRIMIEQLYTPIFQRSRTCPRARQDSVLPSRAGRGLFSQLAGA